MEPTPPATGQLLKSPLASIPLLQAPPATLPPSPIPPAAATSSQAPPTAVSSSQAPSATVPSTCFRPLVNVPTASHPDGQNLKRYGHRAPTFQVWYEMYLGNQLSDEIIGALLYLSPDEVEELKSYIREMLRLPVRPLLLRTFDIHYPYEAPSQELIYKQGDTLLRWHVLAGRAGILLRSCVVFEVSFKYPHLFREPASVEDFEKEWWPDNYHYYTLVPYTYRREILVRLIEACAEDMKKNKNLRILSTDPTPYRKRPASSLENDDASTKRARIDVAPIGNLSFGYHGLTIRKASR